MPSVSRLVASLALAIGLLPALAQAAVLVSNTGTTTNALGQTSPSGLLATGFVSPSTPTQATSVSARFEAGSGAPSVTLQLYSDNAGVPGSALASFGTVTVTTQQDYSFVASSPISLLGSATYWLVASCSNCVSGTTTNNWSTHDPITLAGLPGASVTPNTQFSTNTGATWLSVTSSVRTGIFSVLGDTPPVTTVPLPSAAALLAIGAVGLLGAKRRRGRRSPT